MSISRKKCRVPWCQSSPAAGTWVSFHRFPEQTARKTEWCKRIGIDPLLVLKTSCVCSKHFAPRQFISRQKTHLKKDAVPYISNPGFILETAESVAKLRDESPASSSLSSLEPVKPPVPIQPLPSNSTSASVIISTPALTGTTDTCISSFQQPVPVQVPVPTSADCGVAEVPGVTKLLFRPQPEPTTFKAALDAFKQSETRLSTALSWIKDYLGEFPADLLAKLRCNDNGVDDLPGGCLDGAASVTNLASTNHSRAENTEPKVSSTKFAGSLPASLSAQLGCNDDEIITDSIGSKSVKTPADLSRSRAKPSKTNFLSKSRLKRNIRSAIRPAPLSAPPFDLDDRKLLHEYKSRSHSPIGPNENLVSHSYGVSVKSEPYNIIATADGPIKIVDIHSIIGESNEIFDVNLKHEPVLVQICKYCQAEFQSVSALSVHSLNHAQLRLSRLTNNQDSLELLRTQSHRYCIRPIYKELTVVRRTRAAPLSVTQRWTKRNVKDKELQCDLCPKTCSTENALFNHQFTKHKRPKPCESCGLRLPTNRERNQHMRTEHPELKHRYKCDQCESSFLLEVHLQYHKQKHHRDPSWGFTCEVCGKFCKNRTAYTVHMKWNHADPSEAVTCPTCGIVVKSDYVLTAHMKLHRPSNNCQICGHFFKDAYQLNRHTQAVHSRIRPYKCEHCSATFKTRDGLKEHMKLHGYEPSSSTCSRSYHCDNCSAAFKKKTTLTHHIEHKHKGRKYKCPNCPSLYSLRASLTRHHYRMHDTLILPSESELEIIYTKSPESEGHVTPGESEPGAVAAIKEEI